MASSVDKCPENTVLCSDADESQLLEEKPAMVHRVVYNGFQGHGTRQRAGNDFRHERV